MRVIPVLDILHGRAVHARCGDRQRYEPVRSRLPAPLGDALALARAYHNVLALGDLYIADLDAIARSERNRPLLRSIAALGAHVMVDAGVTTPERARQVLEDGAAAVVVGLETLASFEALASIVQAVGAERVLFSLDLRDGVPIVRGGVPKPGSPLETMRYALGAGVRSVIVLDLARVGTGTGVDVSLVHEMRRAFPGVELLVGGGVRGREDLERLADAGCHGALVASALHDGRLGAADIDAIERRPPPEA